MVNQLFCFAKSLFFFCTDMISQLMSSLKLRWGWGYGFQKAHNKWIENWVTEQMFTVPLQLPKQPHADTEVETELCVVRLFTHSLTHSLIHSLLRSLECFGMSLLFIWSNVLCHSWIKTRRNTWGCTITKKTFKRSICGGWTVPFSGE